jgi:asparagine synthase (glutamine-hydrolysing)
MCGITGIYGIPDREAHASSAKALSRMTAQIAHRGPDANGLWVSDAEVMLGHRRLSIIDTQEQSNQPFIHEATGDVLVFNGEVYNYRELREELKGTFSFRTESDTEVVLAALQAWGAEALHRFNGMFAFAFWSREKRELLLARDRMGIKPLYFSETSHGLVFSSELRSLLASGWIDKRHDPIALSDYLRYQTVHAPRTIVQNVSMLPAGHLMRLQGEETEISAWWDMPSETAKIDGGLPRTERLKRIRNAMEKAVDLRMRSDVPLGAFLSGGIDSSAIVGLMKSATDQQISTFSVTFDEGEFDESTWSRMVAKRFDTDHHEIRLESQDFLHQVPEALTAMDHPSGDGPNTYVVSAATKKEGITVALSGLGGDEAFAGYPVFKRSQQLMEKRWLASWPKGLRKAVGLGYAATKKDATSRKMAALLGGDYFDLEHTYPLSRQIFLESDLRRLAPRAGQQPNRVYQWLTEQIAPETKGFALPFLSKVSLAEMGTYMSHTLLRDTDQMSMAHALEVRVPFLDHNLVLEAMATPDDQKWPHTPKQLLTDSIPDLLPSEVIHRPKMGFVLPWEQWMKGDLKATCEGGLAYLSDVDGISGQEVDRIWSAFLAGDARWTFSRLWALVVLGHWMKENGIR